MLSLDKILFLAIVILASLIILLIYSTDNSHIRERQSFITKTHSDFDKPNYSKVTFNQITSHNVTFNISGHDLLVLLHIQKTGGTTFERHLVHDLEIQNACSCSSDRKRCLCRKPNQKKDANPNIYETWLISRFSTGWACGLHADWTQLTECLRGLQRLFFMTFLRHPLYRFISEYRHVKRGATWKSSKSHCRGYNTQLCYSDRPNWHNVTLNEFLSCPYNMAINRQTRMLANHQSLACSNSYDTNRQMLLNAKSNLDDIAFFGICEHQRASQILFEKTFIYLTRSTEFLICYNPIVYLGLTKRHPVRRFPLQKPSDEIFCQI